MCPVNGVRPTTIPDWEITKGENGIIEAHNYEDNSSQEAFGTIYKLIKKQESWQIIKRVTYER